ncbi:tetratricopeptide repeat protein [Chryseobacterium sp. G0186]|uniref:tetratricopeptide repeat protein n=1 Tax=Chryseobacterium sp. G0186 TaxID=2487064 RepID=UPI000F4F0163|nr:tetratricopeptide repeat protein [Chryseobacterium sp. G0186]AZA76171.1 tetratricopeptide repeat protein [Chryseobacterium sp. G0186]
MIRILLSVLLILLISCKPDSKGYEKSFDVPLMKKNEEFRLAGEYDSLVNLNKKFYRKAEEIGYEDGKALCYINLAEVNISLENYQKSQSFFSDAEAILRNSKNTIHQSKFYNVYGRFNLEMRRLDKAFEYNNEALNLIKKSGKSELKNNILFNIYLRQGTYLIQKKQFTKALEYFQKARKLDDSGLADCAIGDYIYMHKNMDSAYKYVTIAYHKANERKKDDGIALYANTIMGEYYLADKQYDKAEEVLKKALEIDNKTKRIYAYYTKYIYNDLRSVYEKKGDNDKAYFYLNAYTEAKNKNNTAILKTINKDMESFIAETKSDSEDHKKNMRWVIFLSIAGFSLLAVYAWRIINAIRRRKETLKTESEELKTRMNDKSQEDLMELGRKNDPEFLNQFKETYPELINKLLNINPNLEDSELTFCAMLKLHFTSKEIANYTLIQHRTVQQKKYRIRKRLNIPTETDIYQFFDNLD